MNEKNKYVLSFGISLVAVILAISLLTFFNCKNDFSCLGFFILPLIPGILFSKLSSLELNIYTIGIFNGIFYFALGSLIGWVVWKVKKKK